jgi:hypothetical protein
MKLETRFGAVMVHGHPLSNISRIKVGKMGIALRLTSEPLCESNHPNKLPTLRP